MPKKTSSKLPPIGGKAKRGATPNTSTNSASLVAAMLVGVILALGLVLLLYLWNPWGKHEEVSAQPAPASAMAQAAASTPDGQMPDYQFYDLLRQQQVSGIPDQAITASGLPSTAKPDAVVTAPIPSSANAATSAPVTTTDNPMQSATVAAIERNGADYMGGTKTLNDDASAAAGTVTAATANSNDLTNATTYILQINSFDNASDADRRRAEVLMAGVDAQIVKKRDAQDQILYQVISRTMPTAEQAALAHRQLQNNGIDSIIVEQRYR